ncbi:hypothetical protein PPHE_a3540 [Pseudoalteromonas phenolica O-BC30]|nr:hypothetical protein [Pseudoalteromonas phenolica O-BC30]
MKIKNSFFLNPVCAEASCIIFLGGLSNTQLKNASKEAFTFINLSLD